MLHTCQEKNKQHDPELVRSCSRSAKLRLKHRMCRPASGKELARTVRQYRHYTGDQDFNVAEKLIQLIVGLLPLRATDFANSRQQGIIAFGGH
jgi:hypothetical protein